MLNTWNSLKFIIKRQSTPPLSSWIFSRPTVSAAKLNMDENATISNSFTPVDSYPSDPVCQTVANLKLLGSKGVIEGRHLQSIVPLLTESQVDQIIDCLRIKNPSYAVAFFNCLRNDYGLKQSRVSSFVICHILASNRKFKELRSILEQMLQDEGNFFYC